MSINYKALRIGLTVMICLIISNTFSLQYPFFVVLPAITIIANTLMESFVLGFNRLLGSITGALLGIIFAFILPGNIFLSTIGIIFIILICNYFHWEKATTFAMIIFISIMIGFKNQTALTYSYLRLMETIIGIIIVFIVNGFLFPINEKKIIFHLLINTFKDLTYILEHYLEDKITFSKVDNKISSLQKAFDYYDKLNSKKFLPLKSTFNHLLFIYEHLKLLHLYQFTLCEKNQKQYNQLFPNHYPHHVSDDNKENHICNYLFSQILMTYQLILNERGLYNHQV